MTKEQFYKDVEEEFNNVVEALLTQYQIDHRNAFNSRKAKLEQFEHEHNLGLKEGK